MAASWRERLGDGGEDVAGEEQHVLAARHIEGVDRHRAWAAVSPPSPASSACPRRKNNLKRSSYD